MCETAVYVLEGVQCGNDAAVDRSMPALLALMLVERLSLAESYCANLIAGMREDNPRHTLRAILVAIRADIVLRRGHAEQAAELASTALELLPFPNWGMAAGYPMGILVGANTVLDRYAASERLLARFQLQAIGATPFELYLLCARGDHLLAIGDTRSALADFRRAGELALACDLDAPALIPWRLGAGRAYLGQGRVGDARRQFTRHLELLSEESAALRGIGTRLLAGTVEGGERLGLLEQAVTLLDGSEHRLEHVRALADLSNEYFAIGDIIRSRDTAARTMEIAAACANEDLARRLLKESTRFDLTGVLYSGRGTRSVLTDAELRVAGLVAAGMSNREICRRLYLSVSTVEQHLTRIYRKLDVPGRAKLIELTASGAVIPPT
ncbi:LuxR C-terminal-related transcriptional regulator [Embleya sp. NPDC020630]|uniref:LuxR C-terminal-related transcriptional regulator n=1 Tax=Embleya sp. NPDC020630 TaxID=3363979 RepID=UPI00379DAACF